MSVCLLLGACAMADPLNTASEPAAGTRIVHPHDGAVMVYVPAGTFVMGMDREQADKVAKALGYKDYRTIAAEEWFPQRTEWLRGYFIDKYEVTNERWRKFVAQTKYDDTGKARKEPLSDDPSAYAAYPVVRIYWDEAQKYANWAGKMLPSEEQWEKAARGTDGRLFPWGDELPTTEHGQFVDLKTDKATYAVPVGSKPKGASPYGCMDMAGNVYEWTSEWVEPYPNNPEHERLHSYMGHQFGCLRGGSFYHARHSYVAAKRFGFKPTETYFHVGFRTVWVPPAGYFQTEAFKKARAGVAAREAEIQKLRAVAAKPKKGAF